MIEKEKIFEISKKIGYKVGIYCNDEEIEVFEKFLEDYKYKSNLIEKQQKEIEGLKDKNRKLLNQSINLLNDYIYEIQKELENNILEEGK